ncbi:DUF2867 domain-containing protein [Mycolicibacterium fluoranthenivorans]|uniref:DUF2867 domain-containing protein n=1 Tax=Mycolicibacterium fluoranthenivorans TaxID=258505 RepID=UPI001F31C42B|nr:DUF2867 domain-containing protein [Mycolicibacterium fluoranthenivorans]
MTDDGSLRVLVTGATGYIGGRLAPRLLGAGHRVRVLVRDPARIGTVPWAADVEVCQGDLMDRGTLDAACRDVDVIYYLVHSMNSDGEFIEAESRSARNLAEAATHAGVGRIVYLGGLHADSDQLSTHLRSRAQVGQILMDSGIPTVVLQAGVVIGSGSASFEMIRHLSDRLPVMTTPRWVNNHIQPIAVRDVLYYLIAAATAELPKSRTYDIGGPDVLRYGEMMQIYAEVAGLAPRRILVLPVLTPKLAGLWIGLVTPVPRSIGRALIESLSTDAVAAEHDIDAIIAPPPGGPTGYRDAVTLALRLADRGEVETTWANASANGAPSDPLPSDPSWAGEVVYTDVRSIDCGEPVDRVWHALDGGRTQNRRRPFPFGPGRRHWRVEKKTEPQYLRVLAHTRAPASIRLEWQLEPLDAQRTRVHQRAIYTPKGLAGQIYWYALLPMHRAGLAALLRGVAATDHTKERR